MSACVLAGAQLMQFLATTAAADECLRYRATRIRRHVPLHGCGGSGQRGIFECGRCGGTGQLTGEPRAYVEGRGDIRLLGPDGGKATRKPMNRTRRRRWPPEPMP